MLTLTNSKTNRSYTDHPINTLSEHNNYMQLLHEIADDPELRDMPIVDAQRAIIETMIDLDLVL